jgi:hypothetical protein
MSQKVKLIGFINEHKFTISISVSKPHLNEYSDIISTKAHGNFNSLDKTKQMGTGAQIQQI